MSSIYVDRAGEWKLGGVDYMYPASGSESIAPVKTLPFLEKYEPPEKVAGGRKPSEKWLVYPDFLNHHKQLVTVTVCVSICGVDSIYLR